MKVKLTVQIGQHEAGAVIEAMDSVAKMWVKKGMAEAVRATRAKKETATAPEIENSSVSE